MFICLFYYIMTQLIPNEIRYILILIRVVKVIPEASVRDYIVFRIKC